MCLELKDKIYAVFKSEEIYMRRGSMQLDHSIAKFPKKSRPGTSESWIALEPRSKLAGCPY